jgi:MutS domain V
MRPGLLSPGQDLDLDALPPADATLVADLGLERLYVAMSAGDRFIDTVVRRVLPSPLGSIEAIRYRQASVADAIANPDVIRELYAIAVDAIDAERKVWGGSMRNPELVLDRSAEVIGLFLDAFRALRQIQAERAGAFTSPGFLQFFGHIASELDDAWLAEADDHVRRLRTRTLHVGARLGIGNRGTGYVLHRRPSPIGGWRGRLGLEERRSTVEVLLSDVNGMAMIAEIRAQAIASTAGAVHEADRSLLAFFVTLRAELGFLVACVNLRDALQAAGSPICMPEPAGAGECAFTATGLYEPGLRLAITGPVVGSDVLLDGARLILVTGANGGGKSTFLRAVGLAHVMLNAGMFVAAERLSANVRPSLRTHFTRAEDAAMERGKLREELSRLREVVDASFPGSLVLLNESLSSTNEREGAEIARQVVTALVDGGVIVWFVTHNHRFAADLLRDGRDGVAFLRAGLQDGTERSFRIEAGPPEATSHGMDVYDRILGAAGDTGEATQGRGVTGSRETSGPSLTPRADRPTLNP